MPGALPRSAPAASAAPPPRAANAEGEPRRVGVELEFHDLSAAEAGHVAAAVVGGEAQVVDAHHAAVVGGRYGDWTIKLDTALAETAADPEGGWLERLVETARDAALEAMETVTPIEIVAPPVPWPDLTLLDALCDALARAGAAGTNANFFYAFGTHLNVEAWSFEPTEIWRVVRAYGFIEPWLRERQGIDGSRRLLPFVDPYPPASVAKLAETPPPETTEALIDTCCALFPTRNFGLDLLPLLAHLNRQRTAAAVGEAPETLAARPTFHYRLPDCRIGEDGWSVLNEWEGWVQVERVAEDADAMAALERLWRGRGRFTAPTIEEIGAIAG